MKIRMGAPTNKNTDFKEQAIKMAVAQLEKQDVPVVIIIEEYRSNLGFYFRLWRIEVSEEKLEVSHSQWSEPYVEELMMRATAKKTVEVELLKVGCEIKSIQGARIKEKE